MEPIITKETVVNLALLWFITASFCMIYIVSVFIRLDNLGNNKFLIKELLQKIKKPLIISLIILITCICLFLLAVKLA